LGERRYEIVARISDVAIGKCLRVELEDREILLCHTAEGYFAVDNTCSHAETKLEGGRLRGHRLFCPLHGASFDVRDGSVLSRPAMKPIRSYPVRVEGEDVLVAVSEQGGT